MNSLIMKVIKKERIANTDMMGELWEICERVHFCCHNKCPIYAHVLSDNEKEDSSSCIYFKNGEKMLAALEDLCCKEKEKEQEKNKRYFVDKRIGCVAVRDLKNTDMENSCLEGNTKGVVKFWMGSRINTDWDASWTVSEKDVEAAKELCKELNKKK
jgi:hypothetical protein